jgi:hypothetical protein
MKSLGPAAISVSRRRGCNSIMRISAHNALSFFAFMDQAELKLKHLGDKGKPFVDSLRAIRGTFTPDEIDPEFFQRIEAVVTDIADRLVERDMKPVAKFQKIEPAKTRILPDADRAIGYINEAVNWLRDHAE